MRCEDGGIVLRLLLWAALLAVVASAVLFVYVRVQEPLALGEATVRLVKTGADPEAPRLRRAGTIYVATTLRNEGRMPVTITGLGDAGAGAALYVPTSLALGDGETASADAATDFTPITIDPGEGVGVLITYEANGDLDCSAFSAEPDASWPLRAVTVDASAYAMPFTQTVMATPPFARIEGPTRDQCRAAVEPLAA